MSFSFFELQHFFNNKSTKLYLNNTDTSIKGQWMANKRFLVNACYCFCRCFRIHMDLQIWVQRRVFKFSMKFILLVTTITIHLRLGWVHTSRVMHLFYIYYLLIIEWYLQWRHISIWIFPNHLPLSYMRLATDTYQFLAMQTSTSKPSCVYKRNRRVWN